ncbi:MAG: hypothetical protein ACKOX6_06155 [Bdellovibrio sp.]
MNSTHAIALNLEKMHPILDIDSFNETQNLGGVYSVGLVSSPSFITVFSQQKRAAYLAKCLREVLQNNENAGKKSAVKNTTLKIAIVGGGFAGLTLLKSLRTEMTSYLKGSNKRVHIDLFEQNPMLCSIQRGCSIRRIHPNVHLFPQDGWFKDTAEVANLQMKAQSAGEYAKFLVENIVQEIREADAKNKLLEKKGVHCEVWQNTTYLKIQNIEKKYALVARGDVIENQWGDIKPSTKSESYEIIFIATGFGVEVSDDTIANTSYWRNDQNGQVPLNSRAGKYMISGNGDGAVVDFLRLTLVDYQQDQTLKNILPFFKNERGIKHLNGDTESDSLPSYLEEIIKDHYCRNNDISAKSRDTIVNSHKVLLEEFYRELTSFSQEGSSKKNLAAVIDKYWGAIPEKLSEMASEKASKKGSKSKIRNKKGLLELLTDYLIVPRLRQEIELILRLPAGGHGLLEQIIENTKVTFYNRVLFYLVWKQAKQRIHLVSATDFKTTDELLQFYGIPKANSIIRHGADSKIPRRKLGLDDITYRHVLSFSEKQKIENKFEVNLNGYLINGDPISKNKIS